MTVGLCSCSTCQYDVDVRCIYILREAAGIRCIFNLNYYCLFEKNLRATYHFDD